MGYAGSWPYVVRSVEVSDSLAKPTTAISTDSAPEGIDLDATSHLRLGEIGKFLVGGTNERTDVREHQGVCDAEISRATWEVPTDRQRSQVRNGRWRTHEG